MLSGILLELGALPAPTSPAHDATGRAGPEAAFNMIFSRGLAVGSDGNSSNDDVLPTVVRGFTDGRGVPDLLPVELDVQGTLCRVHVLGRCMTDGEGTGRDAATAAIRSQTFCEAAPGRPCAEDFNPKILDF